MDRFSPTDIIYLFKCKENLLYTVYMNIISQQGLATCSFCIKTGKLLSICKDKQQTIVIVTSHDNTEIW